VELTELQSHWFEFGYEGSQIEGLELRKKRTSQEEGLAPLLLGLDERGQAPLPDLFFLLTWSKPALRE